jgi:hypothetical protein
LPPVKKVVPSTDPLQQPVQFLKGIGPEKAKDFHKQSIQVVRDLIERVPRTYRDYSTFKNIMQAQAGQVETLQGRVMSVQEQHLRGRLTLVKVLIGDGSGTAAGVFRTTNSGASWSDVSGGLSSPHVSSIAIDNAGKQYAGTGAGVYDDQIIEPCVPGATTLCLNNGRFRVTAAFLTPQGVSGNARALPESSDTGFFWFFSSQNIEALVKVVNGCAFNDRYWVFAAGLTNVQVMLTVTDTLSGLTRTYTNPQGTPFAPIQDTDAYATCP